MPQVPVAIPVLILRRPELCSEGSTSDTRCLINLQTLLQESPRTIDDLSASLAARKSFLPRDFVVDKANIVWHLPFPFPISLDFLLAMDDLVVNDVPDLALVGLCSVCV